MISKAVRTVFSVLAGYGVIVVLTSLGFSALGGIVHVDAPWHIQAAAAAVALISGAAGGATAATLAARHPVRHATAVLIPLLIDSGFVLASPSPDPLWFEALGAAGLMAATILGGLLVRGLRPRPMVRRSGQAV